MNWTTRKPIDGVWCLVRTSHGAHVSAVFKNGYWQFRNGAEVENVTHWIIYPDFDAPYDDVETLNNDVPSEILLKYLCKQRKHQEDKLGAIEKAYKKAVGKFDSLLSIYNKLKDDYKDFINLQAEKVKSQDKKIIELTAENTKLQNDIAAAIYQNDMLRMQLEVIEKFG